MDFGITGSSDPRLKEGREKFDTGVEYDGKINEAEKSYVFENIDVKLKVRFELNWIAEKSNEPFSDPENLIELFVREIKLLLNANC